VSILFSPSQNGLLSLLSELMEENNIYRIDFLSNGKLLESVTMPIIPPTYSVGDKISLNVQDNGTGFFSLYKVEGISFGIEKTVIADLTNHIYIISLSVKEI